MRSFFLFISLLISTCGMVAQTPLMKLEGKQRYQVAINAREAEITGICIIKTDDEGSRGAVVNEFGIHALDFTISPNRRKVKLVNVMPFMNRWYIKKVVCGDLKFLFSATPEKQKKGKRSVSVEADGTVMLVNSRYGLKYSFLEIRNKDDETAE